MIWDDLLQHLSTRLYGFKRNLATALLETIGKPTNTDPATDSEKEALSMWVLHILNGEYRHSGEHHWTLAEEIMKLCCLYPGYWTRKLGLEALKDNHDLQCDWQDLFDVTSTISPTDSSRAEAPKESWNGSSDQLEEDRMNVDEDSFEREDTELGKGWRRAVVPSNTPLGVVR